MGVGGEAEGGDESEVKGSAGGGNGAEGLEF